MAKWVNDGPYRWVIEGHSFYDSPWISQAEYGFTVQGKQTPVKGFKGVTKASFTRAKKYAEKQLHKYPKMNPSLRSLGKWIKAKAVKVSRSGKVQIKT